MMILSMWESSQPRGIAERIKLQLVKMVRCVALVRAQERLGRVEGASSSSRGSCVSCCVPWAGRYSILHRYALPCPENKIA